MFRVLISLSCILGRNILALYYTDGLAFWEIGKFLHIRDGEDGFSVFKARTVGKLLCKSSSGFSLAQKSLCISGFVATPTHGTTKSFILGFLYCESITLSSFLLNDNFIVLLVKWQMINFFSCFRYVAFYHWILLKFHSCTLHAQCFRES